MVPRSLKVRVGLPGETREASSFLPALGQLHPASGGCRFTNHEASEWLAGNAESRDRPPNQSDGWLIAASGFVLHFGISLSVAATFCIVLRRFADTPARAVTVGLLYGAAVWMFNAALVLPLFDVRHEPFFGGWYIPFLVDHALFVGLPIALVLAQGTWQQAVCASGRRVLRLVPAH